MQADEGTKQRVIGGQYRLDKLLGEGGFGAVYQCTNLTMDTQVALKLLHGHLQDPAQQQRFEREAKTTCKLRHPNTIKVYDFGSTEKGELYMVMEYLEGSPLSKALRDAPFTASRAGWIAAQVCKSLSEAHKLGLVHRDLKPDNLFVTPMEGDPDFIKVLDFGIAKVTNLASQQLTATGTILGTPRYLSLEQAMGKELDGRSDLYSLGVILFEMLTGRPPFAADSAVALLLKHVHEAPPDIFQLRPKGEDAEFDGVAAIARRMLEKEPEARFQSAPDALYAILEVLGRQRVLGRSNPQLGAAVESIKSGTLMLSQDTAQPDVLALADPPSGPQPPTYTPRTPTPAGNTPLARNEALHGAATMAAPAASPRPPQAPVQPNDLQDGPSNRGLLTLVAVLLLIVVGGGVYLATKGEPEVRSPTPIDEDEVAAVPTAIAEPMPEPDEEPASFDPLRDLPTAEPGPPAVLEPQEITPPETGESPTPSLLWVRIESDPPATTVMIGTELIGETPVDIKWAPDEDPPEVELSARGYEKMRVTLKASESGGSKLLVLKALRKQVAVEKKDAEVKGTSTTPKDNALTTQVPKTETKKHFEMVE